jgi:hypothetical protein
VDDGGDWARGLGGAFFSCWFLRCGWGCCIFFWEMVRLFLCLGARFSTLSATQTYLLASMLVSMALRWLLWVICSREDVFLLLMFRFGRAFDWLDGPRVDHVVRLRASDALSGGRCFLCNILAGVVVVA